MIKKNNKTLQESIDELNDHLKKLINSMLESLIIFFHFIRPKYKPKVYRYYLRYKLINNICISWGRDDEDAFSFKFFKHKGASIFKRFSIVLDFTFYGRRLVVEF
jgi:hypothetical protein